MFHRPKTEDKNTEPAPAKAENAAAPASPFAGLRTSSAPEAPRAAPAVTPAPVTNKAAATSVFSTTPTTPTTVTAKPEEKNMSYDDQNKQSPRPLDIPGSSASYQPQPARVPGSAYSSTPSYAGATGIGAAPQANTVAKPAQGRRLVIGEGISLSGEIEACEYLVIEGTVEAALKGASVLEIAQTGTFYGTVEIDEATVAGRFEGELTVSGRLTITSTGSVTGTVAYKELAVEAGATLDGKINPLSGSKVATGKKPDAKAGKAKGPRNDNAGEAGIELPFSGAQSAAG